ncbi:HAD family hydrolase [Desulfocurvus sp. DL9XJH121]
MEENIKDSGLRRVDAVIFDFGGVLAEEGFVAGFEAIARDRGLDTEAVTEAAFAIIREDGYAEGRTDEAAFWAAMRSAAGITGTDAELRAELLDRFKPRPWMFDLVDKLSAAGYKVAILSDQTNWLEELDARFGVFARFDLVWNSWRTGRTKKDPAVFTDMARDLGLAPGRCLFVDDHAGHVRRALDRGMRAIHYVGREAFLGELNDYCPL